MHSQKEGKVSDRKVKMIMTINRAKVINLDWKQKMIFKVLNLVNNQKARVEK